jgi:hypothetical protein
MARQTKADKLIKLLEESIERCQLCNSKIIKEKKKKICINIVCMNNPKIKIK